MHRPNRKKPPSPSRDCQLGAPLGTEKKSKLDPPELVPTPGVLLTLGACVEVQGDPPATALAAAAREALTVLDRRADTAPLQAVLHNLRTLLRRREDTVLPEAERSMLRHKWRGMGMVQHKAKQVRETWRTHLSRLRRAMLLEHKACLELLYAETNLPGIQPC